MYSVFIKILLDYREAYHHISPKPEMEHVLMLLTSDIPAYNFPCLNVIMLEKLQKRKIMNKESSQIDGENEKTLTYMLKNHNTMFYKNKEEFQWA